MTQTSVIANQQTKTSLMEKIRELDEEVGRLKEALRVQNQELEHYGKTKKQLDRYKRALNMLPLKCPIHGAGACREVGSCKRCLEEWDGE